MQSHPLHSIYIQCDCAVCEQKKTKLDKTVKQMKELIGQLNEKLGRAKKQATQDLESDSEPESSSKSAERDPILAKAEIDL